MENMINVSDADPIELVKAAYDLSRPQGLGLIHAVPGPLSDEEAQSIIDDTSSKSCIVRMDYVKGRACKFNIFRGKENSDEMWIRDDWFDHTENDLNKLLERCGVTQ